MLSELQRGVRVLLYVTRKRRSLWRESVSLKRAGRWGCRPRQHCAVWPLSDSRTRCPRWHIHRRNRPASASAPAAAASTSWSMTGRSCSDSQTSAWSAPLRTHCHVAWSWKYERGNHILGRFMFAMYCMQEIMESQLIKENPNWPFGKTCPVTVAMSDKQCCSHMFSCSKNTLRSKEETDNAPRDKAEQLTFGIKQSLSFQSLFLRNSNKKYSFVAL